MEQWSRTWKGEQLKQLAGEWEDCEGCGLSKTRENVVFGMGNPDAKILFIGEGPGNDEDATGVPFCGESGNLLKALTKMAGIEWGDVYVTNIIACKPPDNRDPSTDERNACMGRVQSIVYIVDPWVVVPVGKYALKSLARGRDWAITENHGVVFSSPHPTAKNTGDRNCLEIPGCVFPRTGDDKKKYVLEYEMFPILHPAFLLREDGFDSEKKKKFQSGGWSQKTKNDLITIRKYIEALKKEYSAVPNLTRS